MRDIIRWKPYAGTKCEDGSVRTVYVKGYVAPWVGWMAAYDTVWSCPAFVRVRGKRVQGYLSTEQNMFIPYA